MDTCNFKAQIFHGSCILKHLAEIIFADRGLIFTVLNFHGHSQSVKTAKIMIWRYTVQKLMRLTRGYPDKSKAIVQCSIHDVYNT